VCVHCTTGRGVQILRYRSSVIRPVECRSSRWCRCRWWMLVLRLLNANWSGDARCTPIDFPLHREKRSNVKRYDRTTTQHGKNKQTQRREIKPDWMYRVIHRDHIIVTPVFFLYNNARLFKSSFLEILIRARFLNTSIFL